MIKKTVTYLNFDDERVTEDFYFNLTKGELAERVLTNDGDLVKELQAITQSGNPKLIIDTFKDILKRAYGVRSEDGKKFRKSEEAWEEFVSTEAYSEIFMELCTDAEAASEFIVGILPKDLADGVSENQQTLELPEEDNRPAWLRDNREPTDKELRSMSRDELMLAMQMKSNGQFGG